MITKKLFSVVLGLFLVVASFAAIQPAFADQAFPAGCSSALGNSVTTGSPCNGTPTATQLSAGCTSPIGYSTVNNMPCSGTSIALQYLGGCSSVYGYSVATGAPCNGTTVATLYPPAASQSFSAGCSSAIGDSVTTGMPCNGTSVATQLSAGCPSAVGYSTVNGAHVAELLWPCNTSADAVPFMDTALQPERHVMARPLQLLIHRSEGLPPLQDFQQQQVLTMRH
jgi:hypothetical protein